MFATGAPGGRARVSDGNVSVAIPAHAVIERGVRFGDWKGLSQPQTTCWRRA